MREQDTNIVPLYAAKVKHLVHASTVKVICNHCRHTSDVRISTIKEHCHPESSVDDISRKLRCTVCDVKNNSSIVAGPALGHR